MAGHAAGRQAAVGPTGAVLRLEDLPPPDTRRWVARRKAEVVAGVRAGLLTFEEACQRYNLSEQEFGIWQRAIDQHGLGGLRVTRLQSYAAASRAQAGGPAEGQG
jgi:hypothetical protein